MGINDAAEMLVSAQEEVVRLERENAELRHDRGIVVQLRRYMERYDNGAGVVSHSQGVTLEAIQRILDGAITVWAPSDEPKKAI